MGMLQRDSSSNFKAAYGEYQAEGSPWTNLFVCGDCRKGASLVVTAIAEGRDCAARVDCDTSLPRAAPLAANPAFYQLPQRGEEATTMVTRHQRKKVKGSTQVSDAFERGLLVEPHGEEAEPGSPQAEAQPTVNRRATRELDADVVAPAPKAQEPEPVATAVPTWMAVGVGGLVVMNAALLATVVMLARPKR
eukprot:CAMPEP_0176083656 /NCGR_PEP_ID=MMETSP0120_2-20121206/41857_1 /TAXON_ID=160619 /ORGANISM="Kryptoperidinium foliaceum, Strain CCMP 1326" /LENGTH=191 /DNA_ID=CAMNT_0017417447 /DNA_START=1 /DNA_END=576 /DNA_ORIENTATION=+